MLQGDTTVSRAPGVVEAQFDQVRVVLNEDLTYLGLDEVAQRVWDLLDRPRTVAELVSALTAEYDVSDADCLRDVAPFLQALEQHKLVALQ